MSRQTRAQTRAQSRACMPLFTLDGVRDDPEISIAPLYRSPTADVTPQGPELIRSTTPLTPGGDNRGDTPPVRRDCDDREGRNNTDDAGGPNLDNGLLRSPSPRRIYRPTPRYPRDQQGRGGVRDNDRPMEKGNDPVISTDYEAQSLGFSPIIRGRGDENRHRPANDQVYDRRIGPGNRDDRWPGTDTYYPNRARFTTAERIPLESDHEQCWVNTNRPIPETQMRGPIHRNRKEVGVETYCHDTLGQRVPNRGPREVNDRMEGDDRDGRWGPINAEGGPEIPGPEPDRHRTGRILPWNSNNGQDYGGIDLNRPAPETQRMGPVNRGNRRTGTGNNGSENQDQGLPSRGPTVINDPLGYEDRRYHYPPREPRGPDRRWPESVYNRIGPDITGPLPINPGQAYDELDQNRPQPDKINDRSEKPHRQFMKPAKYNGTGPVESYIAQYEICARHNKWTAREKCDFLQWALDGVATEILWNLQGTGDLTYENLVDRLRQRFGYQGQSETFRAQLFRYKQKPAQSLNDLVFEIRKLTSLSYPNQKDNETVEGIARDMFIQAIADPQLGLKVREREPVSLNDAFKLALRLDSFSKLSGADFTPHPSLPQFNGTDFSPHPSQTAERVRGGPETEFICRRFEEAMRAQTIAQEAFQKSVNDQIQRMNDKTDQRTSHSPGLTTEKQVRFETNNRPPPSPTPTQKQYFPQKQEGSGFNNNWRYRSDQNTRETPSRPYNQPYDQQNRSKEAPRCYNCQMPGHIRRDCPEKWRNRSQRPQVNQSINKKGDREGPKSLYVRPKINGRQLWSLIDTGATENLIHSRFIRNATIRPTTVDLYAANGSKINVKGETVLTVRFSPRCVSKVRFIVSDEISEILLGMEFLKSGKCKLDFQTDTLQIGREIINLTTFVGQRWARRVQIGREITLPPESTSEVPAKMLIGNAEGEGGGEWLLEHKELTPGVHLARAVYEGRGREAVIQVTNTNPTAAIIRANEVLGELTPVSVQSQSHQPDPVNSEVWKAAVAKILNEIPPEVTKEEKALLKNVLFKYRNAFSLDDTDLGCTDLIEHSITTIDDSPIRQSLRRQPMAYQDAIDEHTDLLLQQGVITPSQSEWAANVVLVRKKDNKLRFCIDYRALNAKTRFDAYPVPLTRVCLDSLGGSTYFSVCDLRSGFHQIPIKGADAHRTAFRTRKGLFEYKRTAMGLRGASITCCRLMDLVLKNLNHISCLAYLDDVIIFAADPVTHIQRLGEVLERMERAGLKFRLDKCKIMKRQLIFLGHSISAEGISPDPEKVLKIEQWPIPRKVKQVRSFLGLCTYYKLLVPKFAKLASPLTELTKKGKLFVWSAECQSSFEALKVALTSEPIVAMPNDHDPYVLDVDASLFCIGGVLAQISGGKEKVVAYFSRKLTPAQQNYSTTKREFLALIECVKYFKHHLLGREFLARSDHQALTSIFKAPELYGQYARWIDYLAQFQLTLTHRSGSLHLNADSMSRWGAAETEDKATENGEGARYNLSEGEMGKTQPLKTREFDPEQEPANKQRQEQTEDDERTDTDRDKDGDEFITREVHAVNPRPISVNRSFETPAARIIAMQRADPELSRVIDWVENGAPELADILSDGPEIKTYFFQLHQMEITDNVLYRVNPRKIKQLVIPKALQNEFLTLAHANAASGAHLGIRRTRLTVRARGYFHGWSKYTELFVKNCERCRRYIRRPLPHHGPLQTHRCGEPFEILSIDLTGAHPCTEDGNRYVLTMLCCFSKWIEAIPVKSMTASCVARNLVNTVIVRYGVPRVVLTDRGPAFESALFSELCKILGVHKTRTTSYWPRASPVECWHKTMNSMVAKCVGQNHKRWDETIPLVTSAYRASIHETTGFSPNRIVLGRETRLPLDLVYGLPPSEKVATPVEYVTRMRDEMEEAFKIVRERLQQSAKRRADKYFPTVNPKTFLPGDKVYWYTPQKKKGSYPKWQLCYEGPYVVTRQTSPVNVEIRRLDARGRTFISHIDKLKTCREEETEDLEETQEERDHEEIDREITEREGSQEEGGNDMRGTEMDEEGGEVVEEDTAIAPNDPDPNPDRMTRPRRASKPPVRFM